MPERLQKVIAAAGLASRRTCEQWIVDGRVSVDGEVVTQLGTRADPSIQKVTVDGRRIPPISARRHYIALHKLRGYASTNSDPHAARTILDLVDLPGRLLLRPVGRLDIESEGLIFLSDDGDFINHMTHPRYHIPKTYLATVRGVPSSEGLDRLATGVYLEDGKTAPAERVALTGQFPATDSSDVELVIHEGRNRQVRRMMSAIGHPCLRLVRTHIGPIGLAGLPPGAWRLLTPAEVKRLMSDDGVSASFKTAIRPKRVVSAPPASGPKNMHEGRRGAARNIDTETRKRMDGLGPPQRGRERPASSQTVDSAAVVKRPRRLKEKES